MSDQPIELPKKSFSRNGEDFPTDPSGRPLIAFHRLNASGRARQNYGDTSGLEESLRRQGFIHAIAIDDKPDPQGHYKILDGGRRQRAAMNLFANYKDARFLLVPIVFFSDLDDLHRKEIELDGNVHRKNFEQTELCMLSLEVDRLKKKLYGEASRGGTEGWTQQKTADYMGVSKGQISKQIKLGEIMEKKPALRKIIRDRKMPIDVAIKFAEQIELTEKQSAQLSAGTLVLNSDLKQGDCCELIKEVGTETIDLILTDPPFGIQVIEENQGSTRGEGGGQSYLGTIEQTDNLGLTKVLQLFSQLAPELYRVLKPGSHFYIFHGEEARSGLVGALEKAGLIIQSPVLVWDKGRNVNAFSGYNYMSCYELILFGYKPGGPGTRRRLAEPMKNILTFAPTGRERIHAFQKPTDLLATLIRQSTQAGDLVLDPFAGSGETLHTAKLINRSALGFELSERNFYQAQKYLSSKE